LFGNLRSALMGDFLKHWINKLVTTVHFGILITESLNMSLSFHWVMIGIVQKLRESEPVVAKRHVRFDMERHAVLTTSQ
jgi:hypothetical protein